MRTCPYCRDTIPQHEWLNHLVTCDGTSQSAKLAFRRRTLVEEKRKCETEIGAQKKRIEAIDQMILDIDSMLPGQQELKFEQT